MAVTGEFAEVLTGVDVPIPVEMGSPQLLGQGFELPDVVGIGIKQHLIIVNARRDEKVVVRVLVFRIQPVDKKPLDPGMPDVAGVAGVVHARRKILSGGTVAGGEKSHLFLREMRGFLKPYHGIFLPLVLVNILQRIAVTELDARTVGESEYALGGIVDGKAVQLALHGYEVVFTKLGKRPSEQQQVKPGIPKSKQYELSPHCPALASAARTAVSGMSCARKEEFTLPFAREAFKHQLHYSVFLSERTQTAVMCCRIGLTRLMRNG